MTNEMTISSNNLFDTRPIDNANLGERTKIQYKKALRNYLATGHKLTDANSLGDYAIKLPASSKAFLKAAIRLVTKGTEHDLKSNVTPENLPMVQAALLRLESLNDTIKVNAPKGEKAHTWLNQAQVLALVNTCDDDSLTGRRDWVILALLVGAGLRREELSTLSCDDLVELPGKNGKTRLVLQIKGKGSKNRIVPVNAVLTNKLQAWCKDDIGCGLIARSLGRKCELGDSLSVIGIFEIVRKHGAMIGKPELDPHDLRRTFAQLGYEAGTPLTQISKLLGHENIATTQRYLNLDIDLETTVSDFIPLE